MSPEEFSKLNIGNIIQNKLSEHVYIVHKNTRYKEETEIVLVRTIIAINPSEWELIGE